MMYTFNEKTEFFENKDSNIFYYEESVFELIETGKINKKTFEKWLSHVKKQSYYEGESSRYY